MSTLFKFDGRVRRRRLWEVTLVTTFLSLTAYLIQVLLVTDKTSGVLSLLLTLIILLVLILLSIINISVTIRRWHDLDKSGWWILIGFVPLLGGLYSFYMLGINAGDQGINSYGPPPEQESVLATLAGKEPPPDTPIFEARNISKSFGAVHALNNANLQIFPGQVVALIGDNGAGKSTLINCLTGVFPPDSGNLLFAGEPVHFHSPQDARTLGIETVYQDLAVAPHLDSAANIYLGREMLKPGILGKMGFLDNKFMNEETAAELKRLRVQIPDPRRRVFTLSGGQRQSVAVARSVKWASKVVIMDEPTAALGVAQSQMVLDLTREVRNSGIPVVFISHNMPHVFEVADRIVILRLGTVVAELDPKTDTIDQAVSWMTGSTTAASTNGNRAA